MNVTDRVQILTQRQLNSKFGLVDADNPNNYVSATARVQAGPR